VSKTYLAAAGATILLATVSSQAIAQSTPVPSASAQDAQPAPGEIVVTAQKRSERLNDVPLSITAASGQQLKNQGITDTAQLEKLVPGFTFQHSSFGVPVFTIRGVGFYDTTLGTTPAVSVYVDQIPLPFSAMTRGAVIDLQRVEALKGPQGTLFGQNSTGGAINYIAAKPTDELHAGFDLTYGRFNEVDAEAYVSGPITDTLTFRIAGREEYRGDWQRSYTRDDSLGQKHFYDGRLLLDWKPSEKLKFELSATGWQDRSDTEAGQFFGFVPTKPGGYPLTYENLENYPLSPRTSRAADWTPGVDYRQNNRFYQVALRGDYNISDNVTLTSISSYSRLRDYMPTDVDGTSTFTQQITVSGLLDSISQELRLSGDAGSRIKWMVGGNFSKDQALENQLSQFQTTTSLTPNGVFDAVYIINHQYITTKAAFGSLDYKITDKLTAQGSVRYTKQDRSFHGCAADDGDGTAIHALYELLNPGKTLAPGSCITMDPNTFGLVGLVHSNLNEDNVSWRGSLNYKPISSVLLYANVTKGYKAGSYPSVPGIFTSQFTPVKQESVLAYEAGFKVSLLHHTLDLSGAGFYYDYRDKQILAYRLVQPFGALPALITIPKSRVVGAELEANWHPLRGLALTGGATYVNTRIQKNPVAPFQAFDPYGNLVSFIGDQFPNAPKWQLVGSADYEFPLSSSLKGFAGANVSYRSTASAVLAGTSAFDIRRYALLDLRVGVAAPDDRWRFELWGQNVTNKYYINNAQYTVDAETYTAGLPATYGFRVSFRY
jgi:outer membrane receptor protein involved in Fe transport